jgi:uncharacterized delta-60 repeat protein
MTILRKTLHALLPACAAALAGVPPDALAIDGGGITPIGEPEMAATVLKPVPGDFDNTCELLDDALESQFGGTGSFDVSHTFPVSGLGTAREDSVAAHVDDTGVFWATATSRSLNQGHERPRVEGLALWQQVFVKNTTNAFVHFTVSKAQLSINQALVGFTGGGACARIRAFVAVVPGFTVRLGGDFEEDALYSATTNHFLDFKPRGPMKFTKVENPNGVGTITFDKFNGVLDLSTVAVGQSFALFFNAEAIAGTGSSPEFPGEAIATYRDPISFEGGFTIETDGLTPLNNVVTGPIPRDRSRAIVTQPDGRIVSVGGAFNGTNDDFGVARYNADGSLDTTFDGDGKLTTDFAGGADAARAVALQADGKLIVAGEAGNGSDNDIAVARYNSDGSLDASFGSGGKVRLDLTGTDDVVQSVAVRGDGKIVVAGSVGDGAGRDFLVAQLNADGSIDDSGFGTHGFASLDFAGGADYVTALTVQSDGKIVLAGTANLGATATQTDFALARFNSDGTLDATFGVGGKQTTDIGASADFVEALAVQPGDGKLILAGHTSHDTDASFAIARYSKDGGIDPSFGSGGTLTEDFGGSNDYAYAVAVQPDGKVLVAGYTHAASDDFAVLRLDASGAVDTTFGVGGKVRIDFDSGEDIAATLTQQADGKILVAGWAATSTSDDFAMVRLNP